MAVHQNVMPARQHRQHWPDWRGGLPELHDRGACIRELRSTDAASLLANFNDPMVLRYIAQCPTSLEGFRDFIRWTRGERRHARHACFGIVPTGADVPGRPVGILQIWPIERDFSVAEWGFVLGQPYWGTGLFVRAARLLLDAVFQDGLFGPPGVIRLEARAVDTNERGNGVLRKLGATPEGVLRGSFNTQHGAHDHVMWSILAREWPGLRSRARDAS